MLNIPQNKLPSIRFWNAFRFHLTLPQSHLLTPEHTRQLNIIDRQVTEIMLATERHTGKLRIQRQYWSPDQHRIARSYWRQKMRMHGRKHFIWFHLDQLRHHTDISDSDHKDTSQETIVARLKSSRAAWKQCKKRSALIRQKNPIRSC
jgi:hypothetical protein